MPCMSRLGSRISTGTIVIGLAYTSCSCSVISSLLATRVGAGFGATSDIKHIMDTSFAHLSLDDYLSKVDNFLPQPGKSLCKLPTHGILLHRSIIRHVIFIFGAAPDPAPPQQTKQVNTTVTVNQTETGT
ncbi:Hypothetical predicted protein [Prunus dulcis]|uniref:Uncharacterized protein n=1 Tax=Prunus dulcis TaxID=3755 RepID=A0A5E4EG18_PRUDU|nr:hypothetical protein L3X38_006315 [Prunus dulcis]VVA14653.1 Hypothetical predicted protein [Prunus dulcis]